MSRTHVPSSLGEYGCVEDFKCLVVRLCRRLQVFGSTVVETFKPFVPASPSVFFFGASTGSLVRLSQRLTVCKWHAHTHCDTTEPPNRPVNKEETRSHRSRVTDPYDRAGAATESSDDDHGVPETNELCMCGGGGPVQSLSLIHISEPTRLA